MARFINQHISIAANEKIMPFPGSVIIYQNRFDKIIKNITQKFLRLKFLSKFFIEYQRVMKANEKKMDNLHYFNSLSPYLRNLLKNCRDSGISFHRFL